jgi:hypothetical protein
MKLFLGFLLVCFVGGAALWAAPLKRRVTWLLCLCLLICVAFFFFDQI